MVAAIYAPGLVREDPCGDELVQGAVEAASAGIDVEEYLSARSGGVDHHDALEACEFTIGGAQYALARANGLGHAQIVEFWQHDTRLDVACEAMEIGVTWRQIKKVLGTTMALDGYVKLRATGDSHRAAMRFYRSGRGGFSDYLTLRERGLSRRQAHGVLATGAGIGLYWESTGDGSGHREALRAARARFREDSLAARRNNSPFW